MTAETATVAEEEYLQTLFWLYEAGLPMTGANVARAMQLSAPTVHEMVGRLERDGYITRADRQGRSRFTDDGREHAEAIVRRHRLIERFLTDVLGIPWDEVHEEAERLEHAMSPVLEERMLAAIGDAKTCPHGHPIDVGSRIEGVPLADVEVGATVHDRCASRTRPRTCCTTSRPPASSPASRARSRAATTTRSSSRPPAAAVARHRAASPRRSSVIADPSPPPRVALPEQLVLGARALRALGGARRRRGAAAVARAVVAGVRGRASRGARRRGSGVAVAGEGPRRRGRSRLAGRVVRPALRG